MSYGKESVLMYDLGIELINREYMHEPCLFPQPKLYIVCQT